MELVSCTWKIKIVYIRLVTKRKPSNQNTNHIQDQNWFFMRLVYARTWNLLRIDRVWSMVFGFWIFFFFNFKLREEKKSTEQITMSKEYWKILWTANSNWALNRFPVSLVEFFLRMCVRIALNRPTVVYWMALWTNEMHIGTWHKAHRQPTTTTPILSNSFYCNAQ